MLLQIAHKLLFRASEIHALSPLKHIPVLTDPGYSALLEELNGKITRNYNLFIMLKGGYERYYEEVEELTNSIFQRFTNKSNEKN